MRTPHSSPDDRYPIAVTGVGTAAGLGAAQEPEGPVYVWPLNPWGGHPFQVARS
jgi:hypothetical protein